MWSKWSVDAIQALPRGFDSVAIRFVHYKEHPEAPVGIRYLMAPHAAVLGHDGHAHEGHGGELLSFGRTFRINWSHLRQADRHTWELLAPESDAIKRSERTEARLLATVRSALDHSIPLDDLNVPGLYKKRPEIVVFDVGQGDTILVSLPNDTYWLVDAYSWRTSTFNRVLQELDLRGCKKISRLIVSHFHYDHIRKAQAIIRKFNPDEVVVPDHAHATASARNLLQAAGAKLRRITVPQMAQWGAFRINLCPTGSLAGSNDPNEHGVVMYCESDRANALLSGDVPGWLLEKVILQEGWGFPNRNSFYKVTHHCSATGNWPALLSLVHPRKAGTSCSLTNRFGHPEPTTRRLINSKVSSVGHRLTFLHQDIPFLM